MAVLDKYFLLITFLVTLGYQLSGFFIAWVLQFDKMSSPSMYTTLVLPHLANPHYRLYRRQQLLPIGHLDSLSGQCL